MWLFAILNPSKESHVDRTRKLVLISGFIKGGEKNGTWSTWLVINWSNASGFWFSFGHKSFCVIFLNPFHCHKMVKLMPGFWNVCCTMIVPPGSSCARCCHTGWQSLVLNSRSGLSHTGRYLYVLCTMGLEIRHSFSTITKAGSLF